MKKNTFNANYTLNQFILFYKDKNIEHETKHIECLELMKEWRKFL